MGKIVTKSVDMNANILYLKHEIVADTSKTQARIEFRNMAYGTITAVKFEAKGYNAFGDEIQIDGKPTFDIVVQDLAIAPKKYASLNYVLPRQDIRKLDLKLRQVCYANGKIVDALSEEFVTYRIEDIDENRDVQNQQEREERVILKRRLDEAVCFSKRYGRNWICICGYLNKNTDAICKYCGCKEIEMLQEYSEERVREKIEEKKRKAAAEEARRKGEQIKFEAEQRRQKEEQERREAERKKKIQKRTIKIIGGVVGISVAVGGYCANTNIISSSLDYKDSKEKIAEAKKDEVKNAQYEEQYKTGCDLLNQKSYEKAIETFNKIFRYKDSLDKIREARDAIKADKYNNALKLIDEGSYDEAIEILESLGDFEGCSEQIAEAKYQKACGYLASCKYEEAIEIFKELGDYKDSAQLINDLKEYN